MKPRRLLLPGAIYWLLNCLLSCLPQHSFAQCGGTIQTVTYSTTVHGSGSDTYTMTLPQYDPPLGFTLLSATVDSYLTATAVVTFQNTSAVSNQSFNPSIGRSDILNYNGTDISGGVGTFPYPHTNLLRAGLAGDTKVWPLRTVFNNYNIIDYVIDGSDPFAPPLSDFQGSGDVSFTYTSTSFMNFVPLPVNVSTSSNDDITFSITYTVCNPVLLATDLISFTATRQTDQTILLAWISANEEAGRRYELESSTDGRSFHAFATRQSEVVSGNASYTYSYPIATGAKGKLYFRLKPVNADGTASYSGIRIVDLGGDAGPDFSIYPNPPTDEFVNFVFDSPRSGWQVDVLAANGSLLQRQSYHNTSAGRLYFRRRLAAGVYFARAIDLGSGKPFVKSFVVR